LKKLPKHVKVYLNYFQIGEQDTWQCEVCGRVCPINNGLQIHHIKYRSRLGDDNIGNLCCLCVKCHTEAHNEILKENELTEIHLKFMELYGTR